MGQNAQPARAEGGTAAPGGEALRDTMPLTLLKSLLPWGTRPRRGALPAAREQAGRPRDARRSSRAEAGLIPQDGRDKLLAPEGALPHQPASAAPPPPLAERESEKEGWESLHPQAPAPVLRPAEQAFPEPGAGRPGQGERAGEEPSAKPAASPRGQHSPPTASRRTHALNRRGSSAPDILPAARLGIRQAALHPHVLHICQTLHRRGHTAYVVGGAVRDLILGRRPKDFDIVTEARPEEVKAVFPHARIIGRRFRLCLLRFGDMKVEVSTFRGLPRRGADGMIRRDNTYGTPREDAFRRDFTCNALALDPAQMTIVDYVGGLADLGARHIRTIAPPAVSFAEDPVRMLRAIRFQVRLGFSLDADVAETIRAQAETLRQVTRHRLADEAQRFLTAGQARATFTEFERRGLLRPLLGLEEYAWFFDPAAIARPLTALGDFLERLDRWSASGPEPLPPTVVLLGLLVTLARPEFRAYLAAAPARRSGGGAPADLRTVAQAIVRRFKRELPAMLLQWGLLRGQVVPAFRILGAARLLLRSTHAAAGARRPVRHVPRVGEREAWLLLGIVGPDLGADLEKVREGLARLHELPDLPILDHPRPARHGAPKRSVPSPSLGSGPSVRTQGAPSPGSPPGGTGRRRKRRRGAPGRHAVAPG